MQVCTISGKAGAGKDTFAKYLAAELESRNQSVLITHYADVLKYICKEYLGWDGNKDEPGRAMLQQVGTGLIRRQNENFFVDYMTDILTALNALWDIVLIPDTRFVNEIERMKDCLPTTSICVVSNRGSTLPRYAQMHISETELDGYDFDLVVRNYYAEGCLANEAIRVANELLREG